MKISTNTLTYITTKYQSSDDLLPETVAVLAQKIGAQLGAIEEIEDNGTKYEGVIIAKVITCVDHPNADRLHVCTIDDGGITPDVKRDTNGYVQVVCGAPNVREGILVAWLPPGSTVPDSVGSDPFVLEARELRGVMSNGMLASPRELAVGDAHDGILEIDRDVAPGTSFADAFDLVGDTVLDIENKMFTHRPDCFGWLGVAREIAGIQGKPFVSPVWYTAGMPEVYEKQSEATLPLVVKNELPELVPRFVAVTMSNVVIKPSPVWLQVRLASHGVRPINNVVDITNFLMLETGQPMHAYDYDKVRAMDKGANTATIAVRAPRKDETLALLNGKTITPNPNDILIATASAAIGLGGVMGGADTEVSDETKNIILECANFDMYAIRKTSMNNGVFTDAVTRFTKGQSPLQNKQVAEKAMSMLEKYADAQYVAYYDDDHTDKTPIAVRVSQQFVNERLGYNLSASDMVRLLQNVEFDVQEKAGELIVTVPFWRTDIAIPEDIVEEIGRLYGYDGLPQILPPRSAKPTVKDPSLDTKSRVRSILSRAGANEVLTYSFVHGKTLERAGQHPDDAFSLANALSPDLQYFRLSVLPSLLEKTHPNIKVGYGEFALFEIGKGHAVRLVDSDKAPLEWTNVALAYAADEKTGKQKAGAAFYEARAYAAYLLDSMGIAYSIEPVTFELTNLMDQITAAPFDPRRMAYVRINDTVAGFIGEYSPKVCKNFKLPQYSAGFELSFETLVSAQSHMASYTPLSRFPGVEQDMTFKTTVDVTYFALHAAVNESFLSVVPATASYTLAPIDVYLPSDAPNRHTTFRVKIVDYEKTMTDQEVGMLVDQAVKKVKQSIGAERI